MCNRNRDVRKRQIIPHSSAMLLSKRRDNLVSFYWYFILNYDIF